MSKLMQCAAFGAVLFDVDGVLVDSPHELAWRATLEELMATEWRDLKPRSKYMPEQFTSAVYQAIVAGKPRESGARAALEYFQVPEADIRARHYGEKKQAALLKLISEGEVKAFPDAIRFVLAVKGIGLPMATVSSSKNAQDLLRSIRVDRFGTLFDLFDVDLSRREIARGKPHPDMFLAAAEALGVPASQCLVVEDAPAGIKAAKAGNMTGLGVARAGDAPLLEWAGADRVVTSLDEVDVLELAEGRLVPRRGRAA